MAVILYRIQGGPCLRFEYDLTGPLGIGPARHGAVVDPPGHDHVHRQGIPEPLLRLHTSLFNRTPLFEHSEKEFYFPPTALPLHHGARMWKSRHRETRPQEPLNRFLALGWAGLLGLDRAE